MLLAIVAVSRVMPFAWRWRTETQAKEGALTERVLQRRKVLERREAVTNPPSATARLLEARTAADGAGRLASKLFMHASDMRVQLGTMEPAADSEQVGGVALVYVRAAGLSDIAGLAGLIERLESDPVLMRVRTLRVMAANPAASDEEAEHLRFELRVEALAAIASDDHNARY